MTKTIWTVACLVASAMALVALAGTGSNLGSYGTQFRPAQITGTVTDAGGSPVPGAAVRTNLGHRTITDGSGVYTLFVDTAGLLTLTVETQEGTTSEQVEAAHGTSTGADFAFEPDLGAAVVSLRGAVDARLAAIGDPVPKENKKESKALRKAQKQLLKWVLPDKKGLKAVQKAIAFLSKVAGEDAGVDQAVGTLMTALSAYADSRRADALAALDQIADEKKQGKVRKISNKADKFAGKARVEPSIKKACKLWVKATLGYDAAEAKALKYIGS